MPESRRALAAVVKANERVRKADEHLATMRVELYETVRQAQAEGVSLSEIARTLGVTRQAVQQMARRRAT